MQQKSGAQEQRRIRAVALLACLAVVAVMFLGAILTGVVSLEMDKDRAGSGAMRSDQPP
jgi:hypothetical protein